MQRSNCFFATDQTQKKRKPDRDQSSNKPTKGQGRIVHPTLDTFITCDVLMMRTTVPPFDRSASTPRVSNKSIAGNIGHAPEGITRKGPAMLNGAPDTYYIPTQQMQVPRPSFESCVTRAQNGNSGNKMTKRISRRLSSEAHQHPQNQKNVQQRDKALPPPPLSDACIDSPDTPRHFHVAQQAGLAARDRFEKLQRTSQLLKQPCPDTSPHSSRKNGSETATTPDGLLLLTWDDVCVEELLGIGGFACVCLVTCPKLWKTHKRQYLQKKFQNSGDLDSVDSSLLPPSEDSWMATSTAASNASTTETNAEKYYALKCLSKQTIQQGYEDEDQRTRYAGAAADLVSEAFLLSKLDHPNVVRLYGVTGGAIDQAFLQKGGFFLVMEALNSVLDDMIQVWRKDTVQSVGDFLRKATETVPCVEERLAMGLEIARGMEYLHSRKILFRDLKPHNVGIDREGGLRLFDFGLARECPSGICPGKAGSRRYMAPETMSNKVTCFASDVYSFGITLWELVGLVKPVHFENPDEFERAVCTDNYRPLISAIQNPSVRNLIECCWHKDVESRPTFSRIIELLQSILQTGSQEKWLHTKAGTDLLDGGSFHLTGLSRHAKAGDGSSYRSLMNDSLMTDGDESRVSALTMGSNHSHQSFSNSSVPSLPQNESLQDDPYNTVKLQRSRARRPPKAPRERPPDKNESETTVGISNTARDLRTRRDFCHDAMDTERQEESVFPHASTISNRVGRHPSRPRATPETKANSMATTSSAPEHLQTGSCASSMSSTSSNQSNGSVIKWQRRNRSPGSFRDRSVRRTHSEPLSMLLSSDKN